MSKLGRALKRSLRSLTATEYAKKTGKRDWVYVLSEIKDGALDTLFYSWWDELVQFKFNCQRILRWLPILWKDRDFDSYFIFEILRNKIKFQREYIGKWDRHTTAQEDCKNMRLAEILIERIQKEEYCEVENAAHEAKWGSYDWSMRGRNKDNILFDNKFSKSGLVRSQVKSQADWEQERKESKRIADHEAYMLKQDIKYLFNHLAKHIRRWWD